MKKLIKNLKEYRKWAWEMSCESLDDNINKCLGLISFDECYDCYETSIKENGKIVFLDEDRNEIPDDSVENIALDNSILKLSFPIVVVYNFDNCKINSCEFVSLSDFSLAKFSELPEDSWEKVMVNVVETIGGDGASLTQWKDEIPKAVETAISILDMVEYLDPDCKPGTLTKNFLNNFNNK